MTPRELRALRGEYQVECGKVEAWLNFGRPYDGAFVPELAGKEPPPYGSPEWVEVRGLLNPGLVYDRFLVQVLGFCSEYPDTILETREGVDWRKSHDLAETMAAALARLNALLASAN